MRTRVLMAVVAASALGLAACGSDNSSTSSTAAPAAQAATTAAAATTATTPASTATTAGGAYSEGGGYGAPAPTSAPAAAAATTLTLIDSPLGKILGDAKGNTLYIFTKDTSGTSVCVDACANAWPPAAATGTPTAATGITATGLGTITRADGTTQLAINGQPLYRFAGDAAPGDTAGQGSNQVWWVVGADGTAIKG